MRHLSFLFFILAASCAHNSKINGLEPIEIGNFFGAFIAASDVEEFQESEPPQVFVDGSCMSILQKWSRKHARAGGLVYLAVSGEMIYGRSLYTELIGSGKVKVKEQRHIFIAPADLRVTDKMIFKNHKTKNCSDASRDYMAVSF